jgi:hypothetical protein
MKSKKFVGRYSYPDYLDLFYCKYFGGMYIVDIEVKLE